MIFWGVVTVLIITVINNEIKLTRRDKWLNR